MKDQCKSKTKDHPMTAPEPRNQQSHYTNHDVTQQPRILANMSSRSGYYVNASYDFNQLCSSSLINQIYEAPNAALAL